MLILIQEYNKTSHLKGPVSNSLCFPDLDMPKGCFPVFTI